MLGEQEDEEMWVRQVVSCKDKEEMKRWWRRWRIERKDEEREYETFVAIKKKRRGNGSGDEERKS